MEQRPDVAHLGEGGVHVLDVAGVERQRRLLAHERGLRTWQPLGRRGGDGSQRAEAAERATRRSNLGVIVLAATSTDEACASLRSLRCLRSFLLPFKERINMN